MARSAHAYVRGSTVKFYETLERSRRTKLSEGGMDLRRLSRWKSWAGRRQKWPCLGADQRSGSDRDLAELIDEPWILPPYNSVPGPFIRDIFQAHGLEPPKPSISTLSNQLSMTLIATGQFLGLLNRTVVASTGAPVRLKILPVDILPHKITVDIVTIKNRTLSPLAAAFIECARESVKPFQDRA
jgi:DNA-binding transcriptional LysR family regulator